MSHSQLRSTTPSVSVATQTPNATIQQSIKPVMQEVNNAMFFLRTELHHSNFVFEDLNLRKAWIN
ncbi:MAG: hypothetical protein WBB28_08650 [Crinalium sp.]